MKQTIFTIVLLAFMSLNNLQAQVGVGTTEPDASAALDVTSPDPLNPKGFLPPRMTTTDRNEIASPAPGLTIYNITVNCLQWYIGNNTWHDGCGDNPYLQYPEGTVFCPSGPTEIVDVENPVTNKIWMDRNLGASRAATSSNDAASYGDIYQWGRFSDGHQCRTSDLHNGGVDGLATTSTPTTGAAWDTRFIFTNTSTNDWLQTQDNFLWNTNDPTNASDPTPGKGATDPCPSGYRLPTQVELEAERDSWTQSPINSTIDILGAFNTPLKWPAAGIRRRVDGVVTDEGATGRYWTSTVNGTDAMSLWIAAGSAPMGTLPRANGRSVRCIKE